ncbi:MAG: hypothetical protein GXO49_03665, partial [Chlorobi bacterium]|nr:hypothetical protein [Chlorobiota bacterium]
MILVLSRFIEFLFLVILAIALSRNWKTNIFSLGIHGFILIGAYITAFISTFFFSSIDIKHNSFPAFLIFLAMIIISGIGSMLVAYVFYRIFSKLQDDYFAIASLGFAEMLVIGIASFDILGGASGTSVDIPFIDLGILGKKYFFLIITLFFFSIFFISYLKKEASFEDIFLKAISQNETGIKHLGLNTQ